MRLIRPALTCFLKVEFNNFNYLILISLGLASAGARPGST